MNDVDPLVTDAEADFAAANTPAQLEDAKARYLGKSGLITDRMKALSALPIEEKKAAGARVNVLKQQVEAALTARRDALAQAALDVQLAAEALDVTLPGRRHSTGSIHPISLAMERVAQIFGSMGFDVADGPEIETDWYSFTALNNPENHPARSMADTFYVDVKDADGRWLNLRPHTSPMQVRYAQAHARAHADQATMPDVRVIAPGRTYRVDSDATHSPMFHQVEGLWIGENVSFRDLKALYLDFIQAFFETTALKLRFRPSYFPFTEPSAEIDVMFETGPLADRWLEVSGSGQVHPQVVRNMGIDPERYIGFAFGSGVDRLAMLRYGIDDLRVFFESDIRFLSQFS